MINLNLNRIAIPSIFLFSLVTVTTNSFGEGGPLDAWIKNSGDGPVGWAFHKIWGYPAAQKINVSVTGIPASNGNQPIVVNAPGTQEAGEVARQHLSIEQQEKEAARKRLQEKILARIAEIQSVDKLIYQSGLKNQFNYKLKIDAVCISTKCIKPEISLDDPQKNCLRQVNEEIYTILGVSKYDQYLKAKGIETISIDLIDNRTSARSDKMFWVGSEMTSKTVKDKLTYDKTVTTSKYFRHFTKVIPGPESKFGYDFTETKDYEWNATKEEYEAGNKDKQKDSYDYYYKKDTHSKKYKQTYKKINELKISAMLNSKGECVSLTNGLVTEFEAMTNPEDFKVIASGDKDTKIVDNEIKVSPAGINNKTKKEISIQSSPATMPAKQSTSGETH